MVLHPSQATFDSSVRLEPPHRPLARVHRQFPLPSMKSRLALRSLGPVNRMKEGRYERLIHIHPPDRLSEGRSRRSRSSPSGRASLRPIVTATISSDVAAAL